MCKFENPLSKSPALTVVFRSIELIFHSVVRILQLWWWDKTIYARGVMFLIKFLFFSSLFFTFLHTEFFNFNQLLVVNFGETWDGLDSLGAFRHLVSPNHPSFQQNYHSKNEWGKYTICDLKSEADFYSDWPTFTGDVKTCWALKWGVFLFIFSSPKNTLFQCSALDITSKSNQSL